MSCALKNESQQDRQLNHIFQEYERVKVVLPALEQIQKIMILLIDNNEKMMSGGPIDPGSEWLYSSSAIFSKLDLYPSNEFEILLFSELSSGNVGNISPTMIDPKFAKMYDNLKSLSKLEKQISGFDVSLEATCQTSSSDLYEYGSLEGGATSSGSEDSQRNSQRQITLAPRGETQPQPPFLASRTPESDAIVNQAIIRGIVPFLFLFIMIALFTYNLNDFLAPMLTIVTQTLTNIVSNQAPELDLLPCNLMHQEIANYNMDNLPPTHTLQDYEGYGRRKILYQRPTEGWGPLTGTSGERICYYDNSANMGYPELGLAWMGESINSVAGTLLSPFMQLLSGVSVLGLVGLSVWQLAAYYKRIVSICNSLLQLVLMLTSILKGIFTDIPAARDQYRLGNIDAGTAIERIQRATHLHIRTYMDDMRNLTRDALEHGSSALADTERHTAAIANVTGDAFNSVAALALPGQSAVASLTARQPRGLASLTDRSDQYRQQPQQEFAPQHPHPQHPIPQQPGMMSQAQQPGMMPQAQQPIPDQPGMMPQAQQPGPGKFTEEQIDSMGYKHLQGVAKRLGRTASGNRQQIPANQSAAKLKRSLKEHYGVGASMMQPGMGMRGSQENLNACVETGELGGGGKRLKRSKRLKRNIRTNKKRRTNNKRSKRNNKLTNHKRSKR